MTAVPRTLRWGVRDSFIEYVARSGPHRISGLRVNRTGPFLFGEIADDGNGTVAFQGTIDISAHGGLLRLVLTDPVLRMFGDGLGLLDFTDGASGALFTLLSLTRRDSGTWAAALTADGARVFDDNYPEGAAMSDIVIGDAPPA